MTKTAEAIFQAFCHSRKIVFSNIDDVEKFCLENPNERLTVHIKPIIRQSDKERLYAYYHHVVLKYTVQALTHEGWELVDDVVADYYLKSECAREIIFNPKTNEERTYLVDKSRMTKDRLRKFVNDCILLLEFRHSQLVPDSSEWKIKKGTGRNFKSMKNI